MFLAARPGLWYHRLMEIREKKSFGLMALFKICPLAHSAALIGAALLALHLLSRGNRAFTETLVDEWWRGW